MAYGQGRIFAKKTIYDNITFDSEQECFFYKELKKRNDICNLEVHRAFCLQPEFYNVKGKLHKAITYAPDFIYFDKSDNRVHFVDVKGFVTEEFALKWKMFDKWLLENSQGCYLEVLKYSKTTGFVPIEDYKKEMKSRKQKKQEELNYYKNIVLKQRHEEEMALRKKEREINRMLEIERLIIQGVPLTKYQKDRYKELKKKYGGDVQLKSY